MKQKCCFIISPSPHFQHFNMFSALGRSWKWSARRVKVLSWKGGQRCFTVSQLLLLSSAILPKRFRAKYNEKLYFNRVDTVSFFNTSSAIVIFFVFSRLQTPYCYLMIDFDLCLFECFFELFHFFNGKLCWWGHP